MQKELYLDRVHCAMCKLLACIANALKPILKFFETDIILCN